MRLNRLAGGLLLAGLVAGCASKPKETPAVVADPMTFSRVRDDVMRMDPKAHVGQVTEISTGDNRAAAGNMQTDGLKEGDIVTFLDGNQTPITTGKIIRVLPDAIHVKYERPMPGGRVPLVGDLVVRFN